MDVARPETSSRVANEIVAFGGVGERRAAVGEAAAAEQTQAAASS